MANSFEFIQQRPAIQNALDQAQGLGLDNIAFDTFVDVGDRATIWRTLFSDGILTFESDYKCTFKHIVATIEPVQSGSGDPSPDNVRPISGWTGCEGQRTGANVWDEQWEQGEIKASDGQDNYSTSYWRTKNYIPIKPETSYFISSPTAENQYIRARFYDINKNYIGYAYGSGTGQTGTAFTTPIGAYYMRFAPQISSIPNHDISINYPSTDTSYHAYTGEAISVNWQDEAGTVYGGTLAIDEDGSCKLTVDRIMFDISTLSWVYTANNNRFYASKPSTLPDIVNNETISDRYVYGNTAAQNNTIQPTTSQIYIKDERFTDAASLVASLSGSQTLFKLSTPITYTLPDVTMLSSLLGINNIWASTGGIAVTYKDINPIFLTDPLNVGVMTLK